MNLILVQLSYFYIDFVHLGIGTYKRVDRSPLLI